MSAREAVKILIQSPVYFRLDLKARRDLLHEFLARYGDGRIVVQDLPDIEMVL